MSTKIEQAISEALSALDEMSDEELASEVDSLAEEWAKYEEEGEPFPQAHVVMGVSRSGSTPSYLSNDESEALRRINEFRRLGRQVLKLSYEVTLAAAYIGRELANAFASAKEQAHAKTSSTYIPDDLDSHSQEQVAIEPPTDPDFPMAA